MIIICDQLIRFFKTKEVTEKYFKKHSKIIKHYFTPSDDLLNQINFKYSNIINSNTCSVHIRRTDYVNNQHMEVCDLNYYLTAIEKIEKKY